MAGIDIGLLHGFAATSFTWRHLAPRLTPAHDVSILSRPWAPLADQVDATIAELDRHHLDHPVLIGHSAGAEVAVGVAVARPERVGALVLLGPVFGRGAPPLARAAARIPGLGRVAPGVLRAGGRFLGGALRRAWHDPTLVTPEVVDGYRRPLLEPGVAEALWAMTAANDPRELVLRGAERLEIPCLVIVGRSDRWATPVPLPAAEEVLLDACGHLPHEEQPERTAEEILRFLATLDPPR